MPKLMVALDRCGTARNPSEDFLVEENMLLNILITPTTRLGYRENLANTISNYTYISVEVK